MNFTSGTRATAEAAGPSPPSRQCPTASASREHFKHRGVCTGGLYHSGQGCKPYSVEPCEHHTNSTARPPCQGETQTPRCTHACDNGEYAVGYEEDKSFGGKVYTVEALEEQIRKEMVSSGPVQTAFTVYADFPSYKSGVYQHKTGDALGTLNFYLFKNGKEIS